MPQSIYDNGGMIGVTLDFADTDTYGGGSVTYPAGEAEYTTPGTYSWTAPEGITSVSVVAVGGGGGGGSTGGSGGGGGGGGGLGWKNSIPVVPGLSYTVVVGAGVAADEADEADASYFINTSTVAGFGGKGSSNASGGDGGGFVGDGGGNGGSPNNSGTVDSTGGGGAGGYSGNGGGSSTNTNGQPGSGGGGGGGAAGGSSDAASGGGGVGIYGEGPSGAGGTYTGSNAGAGGGGGSGGADGGPGLSGTGGLFGGGGGGAELNGEAGDGASGAVRLIWGSNRAFPSTNTADGQGDDIVVGSDTRDEVIPVLEDNLEVFSGWSNFGSGTFTQSSTRSFNGTYSGLKDTAGHGNGGVKLLSEPISRPYRMEMRIWTDDSARGSSSSDRIGLLNSSLEGYGLRVPPNAVGVERYNGGYSSMTTLSESAFSKPQLQWYKVVLEANADDTFTTTTYLEDGTLVGSHTTAPDTTYTGTFDRIAIGGGYPYYIDDISIYGTATKPLNKKNSGIWSLASVLETLDIPTSSGQITYGGTTISNPGESLTFPYAGSQQEVIVTGSFNIKMEVWGAAGGGSYNDGNLYTTVNANGGGGGGGYAAGEKIVSDTTLYVYVGGKGEDPSTFAVSGIAAGGWNGGGIGKSDNDDEAGGGGGGATDIRAGGVDLNSRIIVGGGGSGGGFSETVIGGVGGGLEGTSPTAAAPGTQISGYALGIGGDSDGGGNGGGGGGGGYWGGEGGGSNNNGGPGAGGSSYISGLSNSQTIDGISTMPSPLGGSMSGNIGDGYAIITII